MSLELHDSKYDSVPPVPQVQSFCYAFVMADYTHLLGSPRVPRVWYPGAESLWLVRNIGAVSWQPGRSFLASCVAPEGDYWFQVAASKPPVQPGEEAVVGVILTSEASPAVPAPPAPVRLPADASLPLSSPSLDPSAPDLASTPRAFSSQPCVPFLLRLRPVRAGRAGDEGRGRDPDRPEARGRREARPGRGRDLRGRGAREPDRRRAAVRGGRGAPSCRGRASSNQQDNRCCSDHTVVLIRCRRRSAPSRRP
jgi:hypothetical protein